MLGLWAAALVLASAGLREETLRAWELYIERTEARIESELADPERFLVRDSLPPRERAECARQAREGIYVDERRTLTEESKPIEVPGGMIHHWYGSVFVPGADLERVLAWVRSYEDREEFYSGVERSALLENEGERYLVFLRLKREKGPVTVHYDTEHEVIYHRHGETRTSSRSVATRIREIKNAGDPDEVELPPDADRGYLWRLNSYWRFEERDSGVWVECESLSLSRSLPKGTAWFIMALADSVPRDSLESALLPIREHVKPIRSDRPQRMR